MSSDCAWNRYCWGYGTNSKAVTIEKWKGKFPVVFHSWERIGAGRNESCIEYFKHNNQPGVMKAQDCSAECPLLCGKLGESDLSLL